jgi:hypothetical protein
LRDRQILPGFVPGIADGVELCLNRIRGGIWIVERGPQIR